MYNEINVLFGTLAKALDVPEDTLARLLEDGAITLETGRDDRGAPFVLAAHGTGEARRAARVYKDRILHLGEPPEGSVPGSVPSNP
ncbi:hypothetical protein GGD89_003294 [Roseospira visakhapatnamensis]|uniref:Uncharacterized protein n=2 Tax=Roseospira visakhapatnamensis TaxID=390880 RepID=A0A7W6WBL1_9PROT|nr:hypothetical protein [Roseospira visakhapatnamensis]